MKNSKLWLCLFSALAPLTFANESKISMSVDFEQQNDIRDVCSIADFIDSRLSNLDFSIIDFLILFTKFFFACQNHPLRC